MYMYIYYTYIILYTQNKHILYEKKEPRQPQYYNWYYATNPPFKNSWLYIMSSM